MEAYDWMADARAAKGVMPEDEGLLLYRLARARLPHGTVLEGGSYCGKSAIYLGAAAGVVAFLCSERARYVTGAVLTVTGGMDLFTF